MSVSLATAWITGAWISGIKESFHEEGLDIGRNITHASDSPENGEKETALWFKPDELVEWERSTEAWIYE